MDWHKLEPTPGIGTALGGAAKVTAEDNILPEYKSDFTEIFNGVPVKINQLTGFVTEIAYHNTDEGTGLH